MLGNIQKEISELFSIEISKDRMQVWLTIKRPPEDMISAVTPTKVFNILDRAGVRSGIKGDVIGKIITEQLWDEKFLIAEGTLPIEGNPARIEFYFQKDKSLKPKIKDNGHVDYKDVCTVSSVTKNDILLKKFPATKGTPGKDIEGSELSSQKGKDIVVNLGSGTYWDQDDETILRSAFDGIVFYNPRNHKVEVQQVYTVQGSVNYSTGNINVKSVVDIKGDVKPGFTVRSPYNISVKGVVEQANISCDGCLKVGTGIIGKENQVMIIGGDLYSGYIYNQSVVCEGNVYVATEIRNSRIVCSNEVIVENHDGIIIGGSVTAVNKVSAAYIGNLYNVNTEIVVGVNSRIGEMLDKARKESQKLEKQMNNLINQITQVAQTSPQSVFNSRLSIFKKQWNDCNKLNEKLMVEIQNLENNYYCTTDPVVEVTKKIYPGVLLKIKQASFEVKEEISRVKFVLENDQIITLGF